MLMITDMKIQNFIEYMGQLSGLVNIWECITPKQVSRGGRPNLHPTEHSGI